MVLPHLYKKYGLQLGVPGSTLDAAIRYIKDIEGKNAVPILSLKHLATSSDVSYAYLRSVVRRDLDDYIEIPRAKRDGSHRVISAPSEKLKGVQRQILRAIEGVPVHKASFAYRKGLSILDCAREHLGSNWLIKMDLHDYFGQITERRVYTSFRSIGYPPLASLEMARICTRLVPHQEGEQTCSGSSNWRLARGASPGIPDYDQSRMGVLPQGGPTSGAIANLVSSKLDQALERFSIREGLQYTRYSDDLTFSGVGKFDRRRCAELIQESARIISLHAFEVHEKKTKVVSPGGRKIVLGLLVEGEAVRLLPEFRERVQNHVRGVAKFGLVAHVDHRRFRSAISFVNYVDGCLAFASGVDSEWAQRVRANWDNALLNDGFLPLELR